MSERYLQPEVHVVITQQPGVDGISSPARLTQIETDLATMLGRPVIDALDDVPNVSASSPDDGDALVYDADSGEWEAGLVQSGIYRVWNYTTELHGPFSTLQTTPPLYADIHHAVPDRARIHLNVGTSGDAVAAGNHTHAQPLPTRVTTSPQGYISGGSQALGSTSVTLPSGVPCIIEAELSGQFRGSDPGPAYYTLSINIGGPGQSRTSHGGSDGFWCVQGVPDKIHWQHERKITGSGSAVPVSASVQWHSGSGFNIDRTYLKVTVRRDR